MISYDPIAAITYAIQFGDQEENGIFKRMTLDCTNFISQCIWAGYGGTNGFSLTNSEHIEQLRNRVAANYRQTTQWFGRNFNSPYTYASGPFMRVTSLWDYVVNNQWNGPRAIGYNNYGHWNKLKEPIDQGDVLQFFNEPSNRYGHSVIIVSDTHTILENALSSAYVAQHTFDAARRPLINVFETNGGLDHAKVRLLKFTNTNFAS